MPLDSHEVRRRYGSRAALAPVKGSRALTVSEVGEAGLSVSSSMWTKSLEREHLERAVSLIEAGEMTPRWEDFVLQYGELVTKERRSLAAHVLTDLGYLT